MESQLEAEGVREGWMQAAAAAVGSTRPAATSRSVAAGRVSRDPASLRNQTLASHSIYAISPSPTSIREHCRHLLKRNPKSFASMKAARARPVALEDVPDDLVACVIELAGREAW